MTREETKTMNWNGQVLLPRPISMPTIVAQIAPTPIDKMAHQEMPKPAKPEDYNNIPVSEMEHLNEFKNVDPLHRSDKLAKEFNKGSKLRARAKVEGMEKFASHYKKH